MGLMNFVRNRKAVSASRASLNGIAGHQAAMKALGSASKNAKDKNNELWAEDYRQEPKRDPMDSVITKGFGPLDFNKTRPGDQPDPKGNVSLIDPTKDK